MLDAEESFLLAVHASIRGDHHACLMYLREVPCLEAAQL
jgi:hypothetical protein